MAQFPNLFAPYVLGNVPLKNRLVMAPMVVGYASAEGRVTERMKAYYAARAAGGVGLVITEATIVHPRGLGIMNNHACYDDSYLPGLREVAQVIHDGGAKAFMQLCHAGRQTTSKLTGQTPIGPSAIPCPRWQEEPEVLTKDGIREVVEVFADCVRRARDAGFDGVELHGAHGYLINQFFSPISNQRTDEYGGSVENRVRFAVEILRRCREKAGEDYPISIRLSVDEYIDGGLEPPQYQEIARHLEKAGYTAIHCSSGVAASNRRRDLHIFKPETNEGNMIHLAEAIKAAVDIPVIGVGRLVNPATAEEVLAQGKADLVAVGKALLSDPNFPYKAQQGKLDEIRYCLGMGCNACAIRTWQPGISCANNSSLGHEAEFEVVPAQQAKKVLVLGGGVPGLQAAYYAAARGHDVTISTPDAFLGGQLALRTGVPGQAEVRRGLDNLCRQVERAGVKVRLNEAMTVEAVESFGSDALIVSREGEPVLPEALSVDGAQVTSALKVLSGDGNVGQRVVVLGGGLLGAETALYLAAQGKRVTVLVGDGELAGDANPQVKGQVSTRLKEEGVDSMAGAYLITSKGCMTKAGYPQQGTVEGVETVVLAMGHEALPSHLQGLDKGRFQEVHFLGDAYEGVELARLVYQGAKLGLEL